MFSKLYKNKAMKISKECHKYIINNLLDVGAGRCYVARELSRNSINVRCLDIKDYEAVMPLTLYDGKEMPFKSRSFNTILLCYVLHHTMNPIGLLKECVRVAKKRLIIFEDNTDSLLARPLDYMFSKLSGIEAPLHFKTIEEWIEIFYKLNLNIVTIKTGVEKHWYYPVEHLMFVLDKAK